MQLINTTPVPARLEAAQVEGMPNRVGMLTAKATFRFALDGRVELETQKPFPLLADDQPTPLGLLPSDAEPRRDQAFEVILLGHAYAPEGRPVEQLTVSLTVGSVRREILVIGDRVWMKNDHGPSISRPTPFTKCPLSWNRAFGGSHPVKIDASSVLDVADPVNPHGRGFDVEGRARAIAGSLRAPPGYPVLAEYQRHLPNLEDPRARIARWEDAPAPLCWATTPRDVFVAPLARAKKSPPPTMDGPPQDFEAEEATGPNAAYFRGHPDWLMPAPREAPVVRLENLVAERAVVQFRVPPLRLVGDYVVEGRKGTRTLNPLAMVILADDRLFYILYSLPFTFPFLSGDERAFRLRIAEPWYPDASAP